MSKTDRFNVSVKAGGKTYAPGQAVPIGGKGGMTDEDAARIRSEFGTFTGSPEVNSDAGGLLGTAEIEALNQRNDTLVTEKRELEGKLAAKTQEYERLVAENSKLAAKYEKLDADHTQLGKDNIALGERITTLEAEIVKLKKPA
ncbi:hypothetical protein AM571_CH01430 [Rhizobium etli 8C-3]|uniref:Uncharacterized protein n=1 Tax=Rhizobium etli 8C-3 TaxID=538025 RepID=A0A1L5P2A4_RHIET|nr:hypothetical protein [Rhizobium etli]APO74265.1 hypothetical protein AM571_CH01430 [Rhizobium etli 8C-3]